MMDEPNLTVSVNTAEQKQAFDEVKAERDYQDRLWNNDKRHDDTHETPATFRHYINQYNTDEPTVRGKARTDREKFIKVAALAIAAIESIDRKANNA